MATPINVHEAKTHLSRLVEQVAAGKPMARLVPMGAAVPPKKLGQFTSRIKVPDDFNTPLEAPTLALFRGG
jgi:antitoxin (DNA-binding transcriptional repressor) of toxin-antitoxin stability system